MANNQENTDKKVLYCPNSFFNNGEISIGEFKTFDEAMNFPIKEVWCINRTNDNKFQAYKSQSTRILIICNWSKSIQDPTKFVVALVFSNGKITYLDMNDLPMNAKNFENSLNHDVLYAIYLVADEAYKKKITNKN